MNVPLPDVEVGSRELENLIARAQDGDEVAVETMLERFRPLLRSLMHRAWLSLQEHIPHAEWADVESQVQLCFLVRLRDYEAERGVYFPHYITQMLRWDLRVWLRRQRVAAAVPFSQLSDTETNFEFEEGLSQSSSTQEPSDVAVEVEKTLSLRQAMRTLTTPQREVVWECYVLGHTEHQAAARLRISRSTVRNRLDGALQKLRGFFHEREDEIGSSTKLSTTTRTGRTLLVEPETQHTFKLLKMSTSFEQKRPDLVGVGAGRPVLLQGVFDFLAGGLKESELLSPKLTFTVPPGHVLGVRYLRAGVSCAGMVCLSTVVNGLPHRLVPVAANSAIHVPFAIVDPIIAGSQLEIHCSAEAPGTVILDVGCLLMPA